MLFVAILNPAAFTIIQVEASNAVDRTECRCQCVHQLSKKDEATARVISVSALCRLQEIHAVGVPWDNSFLEPSENRVKGHCNQKATRKTALSYSSGHQCANFRLRCDTIDDSGVSTHSFLEPSEDRVKGDCKKETTRWTALSYSSCHQELSSFCSCKFHVCDAVLANAS